MTTPKFLPGVGREFDRGELIVYVRRLAHAEAELREARSVIMRVASGKWWLRALGVVLASIYRARRLAATPLRIGGRK